MLRRPDNLTFIPGAQGGRKSTPENDPLTATHKLQYVRANIHTHTHTLNKVNVKTKSSVG